MTNPKRYDPVIYGDETGVDDGRYVRWEDYERLQAIIANCRTYVAEAADRYPRGQPSVLLAAIDKATNTSEPGVVVSDLEITPEMEAEMSRPGQIQFVPSPYVEVGELVLIDEEPGQKPLIFAEWNPVRYELPAGTKLYAMRSLGASRDASSDWQIGPDTRDPGCKCVVSGSVVDCSTCPIHGLPSPSRT